MAQIKTGIVIARPLDFVFNYMAEKMDDYLVRLEPKLLIVEQTTEGEVGAGTQFRLISSNSGSDRDPTKVELLRGLDLEALEPELRKEIKVAFVEVISFERNKLLETIRVDEGNGKLIERYIFREAEDNTTLLDYSQGLDFTKIKDKVKFDDTAFNSKIGLFALSLFWKPLMKFGFGFQLKSLKTIIEAEPYNN